MKKNILLITVLSFLLTSNLSAQKKKVNLKTEKDKMAYSIGYDLGKNVFRELSKIEIPKESFLNGIYDAVKNSNSVLSDSSMKESLAKFESLLKENRQKELEIEDEIWGAAGKKYLEENAKRDSVKTLPSGLQYKVIANGVGAKPKTTDTVVTHYSGTLIDGTEFDNSYSRGEPASFPVNRVIKGWTEALQLMNVGSKWELFIPSELAYGKQRRSQEIRPNSVLIFTIELLQIK